MLLNTLSFVVMFFTIAFTPQTEGAEDSVNILSSDTSNFKCEELTKADRLPPGWDWTKVGDKLDSKKCFENIAANRKLYDSLDHARQLFEVARTRPGIVTEELFCPLAEEIVHYALGKDLATLEACGADKSRYPAAVVATIFKNAGYTLTGIGYKNFRWGAIFDSSDIKPKLKQRLWLALVAVLHENHNEKLGEQWRILSFFRYITDNHGIDLNPSTPLTELDTQIIRLLPVAIEYILSIEEKGFFMDLHMKEIKAFYKALHGKIAGNPALSLYLHSRFFINPAVDLPSKLTYIELELPPINDIQMTKEIFAYGDNLSSISDPVERRLATAARHQLETLLFHEQRHLPPPEQQHLPPLEQQRLPPPEPTLFATLGGLNEFYV